MHVLLRGRVAGAEVGDIDSASLLLRAVRGIVLGVVGARPDAVPCSRLRVLAQGAKDRSHPLLPPHRALARCIALDWQQLLHARERTKFPIAWQLCACSATER